MKNSHSILLMFFVIITSVMNSYSQSDGVLYCYSCGDGSDGAFIAANNTSLAAGEYNYTSFIIASGVTLNITGSQPIVIRCTGDVLIDGFITLSGSNGTDGVTLSNAGSGGVGVAGGGMGGNGIFDAINGPIDGFSGLGNGAGGHGSNWSGGGGAGFIMAGNNSGGTGGIGGSVYGDQFLSDLFGGSGGGGGSGGNNCGSGGGGAGGGAMAIFTCSNFYIGVAGMISSNGGNAGSDGNGNCGGGGGGSGGSIWIGCDTIQNSGTISVTGGFGGLTSYPPDGFGGDGSPGRIRLDYNTGNIGTLQPITYFDSWPLSATLDFVMNTTCDNSADGSLEINVLGGAPGYTFLWSNGSTDEDISALVEGNYTVTVTDTTNCTVTFTATVLAPDAIVISMSSTPSGANNDQGTADAVVTGGISPYTYSWSNAATTSSISNLSFGTYSVTVTDANGCTSTNSVIVSQFSGIDQSTILAQFNIYPNPVKDQLLFTISNKMMLTNSDIYITDVTGRKLATAVEWTGDHYLMNVSSFADGIYFLNLTGNNYFLHKQFIIQK